MHYALSDIHGDSAAFDAVLALIDLQPEDQLYVIGDVIDRGPDGIALLQRIREMPNATLLLGNHEYMMINALRHPEDNWAAYQWYRNGCEETLQRFYDLIPQAREELLLYLESLPAQLELTINARKYCLVHAAPLELYEAGRWKDERELAVWQRIPLAPPPIRDRTVLIGHTPTRHVQRADWPTMRIAHGDGVIDLDCGCVFPEYGGQLGCLRLEDGMEFYSAEGPVTAGEAAEWKAQYVQPI
ncbi:MAG: metallophosphoesterase [Clostridia bacterium]|nr:metallophosphoesterase [Clostridia bacterium]